jgi:hypothetical protein
MQAEILAKEFLLEEDMLEEDMHSGIQPSKCKQVVRCIRIFGYTFFGKHIYAKYTYQAMMLRCLHRRKHTSYACA